MAAFATCCRLSNPHTKSAGLRHPDAVECGWKDSVLMHRFRIVCLVALCLVPSLGLLGQAPPAHPTQDKAASHRPVSFAFEPLDTWKAAVLAGDRPALTNLYMTNPVAKSKT